MPIKDGRMTNLNFDSYEILRLVEMPMRSLPLKNVKVV
jgi:hypothetical protein